MANSRPVLTITILQVIMALVDPVPVVSQNTANTSSSTSRVTPTSAELLAPSSLVLVMCFIVIAILFCAKSYHCKTVSRRDNKVRDHDWELYIVSAFLPQKAPQRNGDTTTPAYLKALDWKSKALPFLTDFDKELLNSLQVFFNSPSDIFSMCFPAFLTLIVGPCLMLFFYGFTEFFWSVEKYPSLPNINQCVACFLTPAGLVYAISFGFAFQQAINKQTEILEKMTHEISLLDQAATLTSKLKLNSNKVRMQIYRAIKAEAMYMILQVQNRKTSDLKNKPNYDVKVEIWKVLKYLADIPRFSRHHIDRVMSQTIIEYVSHLNNVCSDQIGVLHSKIHWLKWAFLVTLGVFSLFGIMLIQAFSYRMELMMSTLTLFSIAMLCYIVADLDSPFSGFFRIDVSIIADVVYRLEAMYKMAEMGFNETACYPDSSKFRYKR